MIPVGSDNRVGFCGTGPGVSTGPGFLPPDVFQSDVFQDKFVGVPQTLNKLSSDLPVGVPNPVGASYHPCTGDGTCDDVWQRHKDGMDQITAATGAEIGSRIGGHAGPVGAFAGGIIGGIIGGAIGLFN